MITSSSVTSVIQSFLSTGRKKLAFNEIKHISNLSKDEIASVLAEHCVMFTSSWETEVVYILKGYSSFKKAYDLWIKYNKKKMKLNFSCDEMSVINELSDLRYKKRRIESLRKKISLTCAYANIVIDSLCAKGIIDVLYEAQDSTLNENTLVCLSDKFNCLKYIIFINGNFKLS